MNDIFSKYELYLDLSINIFIIIESKGRLDDDSG